MPSFFFHLTFELNTSPTDWRYDHLSCQTMALSNAPLHDQPTSETQDLGWGVIRLYRDAEDTRGLYEPPPSKSASHGKNRSSLGVEDAAFKDEDCTTLCILAVPSYLTPSDFLGFVGEKTREEVSHFRMVRTERGNRYMVLMKFRSGKRAREWRRDWNGKAFDGMEVRGLPPFIIPSSAYRGGGYSAVNES